MNCASRAEGITAGLPQNHPFKKEKYRGMENKFTIRYKGWRIEKYNSGLFKTFIRKTTWLYRNLYGNYCSFFHTGLPLNGAT
jgi:hypothetical protein